MTGLLVLTAIAAPALFWIFYFRYKDRYSPEPALSLGGTFILGFIFSAGYLKFSEFFPLMGIPSDQSAFIFDGSFTSFAYLIFVVGFFEELFKLFPFLFMIKWSRHYDEKLDGIIYASVAALGFAAFENLIYLPHIEGFQLLGRALASPLTHTIFASIWGYTTGLTILENRKNYLKAVSVFVFSFVMHGVYDFLSLSGALRIFSSLLILLIWIWRIRLIEKEIGLLKKQG